MALSLALAAHIDRTRCLLLCALLAVGVSACGNETAPLPDVPPARADLGDKSFLPGWRTTLIDWVLDGRVALGARSGYVALVARDGQVVHAKTSGYQDVEAQIPMSLDTRFHMASMTKPVVAVAAMILIEEGRITLEDPVSDYLPWVGAMPVAILDENGEVARTTPQTQSMKLRHLLSFSSGIAGASFEKTTHS